MINRWQSHSSWLEWLDPSSWSSIRGRGTPQTGGNLLDTCCFLFYTLVTVVFLSLHVLCIILQGSGLGLVALWPNLCFAQGATVEFFSHELLLWLSSWSFLPTVFDNCHLFNNHVVHAVNQVYSGEETELLGILAALGPFAFKPTKAVYDAYSKLVIAIGPLTVKLARLHRHGCHPQNRSLQ